MYGSVVSLRARGRLIVCAIALVALSAMMFAPGIASAKETPPTTTYLALGDSIAFGQTEELFNINKPNESPSFFEEGYVNDLAKDLKKPSELGKGLTVVNDSCPSDTTNTFIGENEALGGKVSTEEPSPPTPYQGYGGDYHPCAYHFQEGFPLRNSLGSESQLEDALSILNEGHPAHEVKVITLDIGSADELAGLTECEDVVAQEFNEIEKGERSGPPGNYGENRKESWALCVAARALGHGPNAHGAGTDENVFEHIVKNLNTILTDLTGTGPGQGHYTGPIVLGGYYNPDAFVIPGSDGLQERLNEAVEKEVVANYPNVTYANPMAVFNTESEAKEKKTICK